MAKKQSRRSVSVTRELYERAQAFASAHGDVPIAQLVSQGLEAVLAGVQPLEPARDSTVLAVETWQGRRRDFVREATPPRTVVPREVFARLAAQARAIVDRDAKPEISVPEQVLRSSQQLQIPDELRVDLKVTANRYGGSPSSVLEVALHRLVDHLERPGHVWCRACLQDLGDCACKEPQTAARAVAG